MGKRRLQIDFRPARGHENTSLAYTVLGRHKRRGEQAETILEAYRSYDPSESIQITNILDFENAAKELVSRYKIGSREDIVNVIAHAPADENIELTNPGVKNFSFPDTNKTANDLLRAFDPIRYRDRAAVMMKMLYQFFAHGNNLYYNKLSAARLLDWLKSEHAASSIIGTEKLDRIIDFIEFAAEDEMRKCYIEKKEHVGTSEDLRELLGIASDCAYEK